MTHTLLDVARMGVHGDTLGYTYAKQAGIELDPKSHAARAGKAAEANKRRSNFELSDERKIEVISKYKHGMKISSIARRYVEPGKVGQTVIENRIHELIGNL